MPRCALSRPGAGRPQNSGGIAGERPPPEGAARTCPGSFQKCERPLRPLGHRFTNTKQSAYARHLCLNTATNLLGFNLMQLQGNSERRGRCSWLGRRTGRGLMKFLLSRDTPGRRTKRNTAAQPTGPLGGSGGGRPAPSALRGRSLRPWRSHALGGAPAKHSELRAGPALTDGIH